MAWRLSIKPGAEKSLSRLDSPIRRRIDAFLLRLAQADDPRQFLEPYTGPLAGYYKKVIAKNWRVIVDVRTAERVLDILDVGHRSEIYRQR